MPQAGEFTEGLISQKHEKLCPKHPRLRLAPELGTGQKNHEAEHDSTGDPCCSDVELGVWKLDGPLGDGGRAMLGGFPHYKEHLRCSRSSRWHAIIVRQEGLHLGPSILVGFRFHAERN